MNLYRYSVLITGASARGLSRLPWSPTGSTTPAALGQLFGARVHKDRTANTIATSKARPIAISSRITVCAFFEGHLVTRADLPFRNLTQAGQYYTERFAPPWATQQDRPAGRARAHRAPSPRERSPAVAERLYCGSRSGAAMVIGPADDLPQRMRPKERPARMYGGAFFVLWSTLRTVVTRKMRRWPLGWIDVFRVAAELDVGGLSLSIQMECVRTRYPQVAW